MDPLSIATATVGLVTFCGQSITILLKFVGDTKSVNRTIQLFSNEIANLKRVLESVSLSLQDPRLLSLETGTGHEAQHYQDVVQCLRDCYTCMERLVKILHMLQSNDRNIFYRVKKQLRLNIESGEMSILRRQILSYTQTMHISLQMLLLSSQMTPSEQISLGVLPRLDQLTMSINEVLAIVRSQIRDGAPIIDPTCAKIYSRGPLSISSVRTGEDTQQEIPSQAPVPGSDEYDDAMNVLLPASGTATPSELESVGLLTSTDPDSTALHIEILESNETAFGNMQKCLRSAGNLVSSMSTTLTSDTESILLSTFEDSVAGERRAVIEDWISSDESWSTVSENSAARGSLQSETTKSLEQKVLLNFYQLGKENFEAAHYPRAEQFLCRFLEMCGPSYDLEKRNEGREMLATSLVKQKRPQEAEKILLSRIDDASEHDKALQATYLLSGLYFDTKNFQKAELYCRKVIEPAEALYGRAHPLFQQSAELLLEIYRSSGDIVSFEAYRSVLSPSSGQIVKGGVAWQKGMALLESHGFSLERMNQEQKSIVLRWAAEKGHENVVHILIETGGGIKDVVNTKDRIGKTALHYASIYGHASIGYILVSQGAEVDIRAACSMNSTHLAAAYDEAEAVKMLLDSGADVNFRTSNGKTPLHQAVESNSLRACEVLLSRNAETEATDSENRTPLFYGCTKNRTEAVKRLLLYRASVNVTDSRGFTPLHYAAAQGYQELAQLLLEHGADVAAQATDGRDSLWFATVGGYSGILLTLLNYGAPIHRTYNNGSKRSTALSYAEKHGPREIAHLLASSEAERE